MGDIRYKPTKEENQLFERIIKKTGWKKTDIVKIAIADLLNKYGLLKEDEKKR